MLKYALLSGVLLLLAACNGQSPTTLPVETAVTTAADGFPTGTIYANEILAGAQNLIAYRPAQDVKTTLFAVPDNGWLSSFDYNRGRSQFVLAYAPPPPAGDIQLGYTALFLWSETMREPELLLEPGSEEDVYFNPIWPPDGDYIYYSHVAPLDLEAYTFATTLERLHLPSGEVDVIAADGIWPQLNAAGDRLVYVAVEPETMANALIMAKADGTAPQTLIDNATFTAIDAPVFSNDGRWLYFSAVALDQPTRAWWEIVLGIQTVSAHSLPSDWYRLPATGGTPEQLTNVGQVGLYGRFSPAGSDEFAFSSQSGLFLLPAATPATTSDLDELLSGSFSGAFSWVP